MEGIAAAKVKGVYTGRKPSIEADQVRQLARSGMGGTAIAKQLKISRASVYRLLEERLEEARDADIAAKANGVPNLFPAGYDAWSDLATAKRADTE